MVIMVVVLSVVRGDDGVNNVVLVILEVMII